MFLKKDLKRFCVATVLSVKKGYIIGVLGPDDFKLVKGEDLLTFVSILYKTAQHYFCKICGIHTHNRPRINPKNIWNKYSLC